MTGRHNSSKFVAVSLSLLLCASLTIFLVSKRESIINELESSLASLEQKLENASASGNVQEVMELGQKHQDLTNKLESTINQWGN